MRGKPSMKALVLDLLASLVRIFEHIGTSDLRSDKNPVEITWIFINCSVILVVDLHDLHSMNRMHPKKLLYLSIRTSKHSDT